MDITLEHQIKNVVNTPCTCIVGTFDGVHGGHISIIKKTVSISIENNLLPRALIFVKRPSEFIKPQEPSTYILRFQDRINLIKRYGIAEVVPLQFNEHIQKTTAEEFIKTLHQKLGLRTLVIGYNARMGCDLADSDSIKNICSKIGIKVYVEGELLSYSCKPISSTAIRKSIAEGDVVTAREMLGHSYELVGCVVRGNGRGRKLGYPTANLRLESNVLVPADGVYASFTSLDKQGYSLSVTSIGVRPTFEPSSERTIETHIINYKVKDLYNRIISIDFIQRIREERKFKKLASLIKQIKADVKQAQKIVQQ